MLFKSYVNRGTDILADVPWVDSKNDCNQISVGNTGTLNNTDCGTIDGKMCLYFLKISNIFNEYYTGYHSLYMAFSSCYIGNYIPSFHTSLTFKQATEDIYVLVFAGLKWK